MSHSPFGVKNSNFTADGLSSDVGRYQRHGIDQVYSYCSTVENANLNQVRRPLVVKVSLKNAKQWWCEKRGISSKNKVEGRVIVVGLHSKQCGKIKYEPTRLRDLNDCFWLFLVDFLHWWAEIVESGFRCPPLIYAIVSNNLFLTQQRNMKTQTNKQTNKFYTLLYNIVCFRTYVI